MTGRRGVGTAATIGCLLLLVSGLYVVRDERPDTARTRATATVRAGTADRPVPRPITPDVISTGRAGRRPPPAAGDRDVVAAACPAPAAGAGAGGRPRRPRTTGQSSASPEDALEITSGDAASPTSQGLGADQVAVVPAEAVTPTVQVAVVGGVDPLLDPSAYPITTKADTAQPEVHRVTLVGDIMLGRGSGPRTPRRPGAALGPMSERLSDADLTVGNLESTLSDAGPPQQGDDSFYADPRVLAALERAGFDVLSLANNHTGDYGERALRQTIRRLDASPIARVGAGPTLGDGVAAAGGGDAAA